MRWWWLGLILGCASSPSPYQTFDPFDYVQAGVDPKEEARAVQKGLTDNGYYLGVRHEADTYVAMEASRGEAWAIRVVTRRGIAMGIDVPNARAPDWRAVRLLRTPHGDLDGDGFDELVVAVYAEDDAPCLGLIRVATEGVVGEVPLPLKSLAVEACVGSFSDVVGDSQLEAVVRALAEEAGLRIWVPMLLTGDKGRWVTPPESVLTEYWQGERERRRQAAGKGGDPAQRYRRAVEVAELTRLLGEDRDAQIDAFDEMIRGVRFSPELKKYATRYRQHLRYSGAVIEPDEDGVLKPGSDER